VSDRSRRRACGGAGRAQALGEAGSLAGSHPLGAVAAGILTFVVGLSIGVWGFEQWRADQDRLAIAARAEGTVTGHLNGRPVIAFALPSGDRVSFTATNVGRDDYPDGKRVDVLYPMDRPTEAIVDRPRARRARHSLVAIGSLALMALGGYVSWYARHYDLRRG
jgi:hypothetical protein